MMRDSIRRCVDAYKFGISLLWEVNKVIPIMPCRKGHAGGCAVVIHNYEW